MNTQTEKIYLNEESIANESLELLGLYYDITQSMVGRKVPFSGWKDAQLLLKQLWVHSLTIISLKNGIVLKLPRKEYQETFFESPSVLVLTRVLIETYYTLRQVFFETVNDIDKFEFEYCAWKLSGYCIFTSSYVLANKDPKEVKIARENIETYTEMLRTNLYFQKESHKVQGDLLKGKRQISWDLISNKIGFDPEMNKFLRSYLSGFIHPDGLSVDEMAHLIKIPDNKYEISLMINIVNVILAKVIIDLFSLTDFARDACKKNRRAANIAFDLSGAIFPEPPIAIV